VIEVGGLLTFGGPTVVPGDWVYVDEAGLIAVPWEGRAQVADAARAIEADDAEAVRRIREG